MQAMWVKTQVVDTVALEGVTIASAYAIVDENAKNGPRLTLLRAAAHQRQTCSTPRQTPFGVATRLIVPVTYGARHNLKAKAPSTSQRSILPPAFATRVNVAAQFTCAQ